jgi:hypothetical protein
LAHRPAVGASGGISLKLVEGGGQTDACGRELSQLVIKLGTVSELSRREDERHGV